MNPVIKYSGGRPAPAARLVKTEYLFGAAIRDGVACLVLPYPPTNNNFKRLALVNGKPRLVLTGAAKDYKKKAGELAREASWPQLSGPLCVTLRAYRPRRIGDLDNVQKVVLDSLTGIAYEDDGQIVQIVASRFDDKHDPRVEVEICEIENGGL